MLDCFTTAVEVEHARIGWKGRYLATYLLIFPLSVRQINISTLFSKAMLQAVVARASVGVSFLALLIASYLTSL